MKQDEMKAEETTLHFLPEAAAPDHLEPGDIDEELDDDALDDVAGGDWAPVPPPPPSGGGG